jgi:hypothetical protein
MILVLFTLLAQNLMPTVPGAIDPAVTDANVQQTICKRGYTAKVRNVSEATKAAVYARDHRVKERGHCCEIDHAIPLELGGSNALENLWAQPYTPRPAAHEKDKVENFLRASVCRGAMPLALARDAVHNHWPSVYEEKIKK